MIQLTNMIDISIFCINNCLVEWSLTVLWDTISIYIGPSPRQRGWSGGAIVLGKFPVPGRPKIWITVGQGPMRL